MEAIINHPEEGFIILKQSGENIAEPKGRFRKFSLNFPGMDKHIAGKPPSKGQKKPNTNHIRAFTSLFDGKPSLFSKTLPKPETGMVAGVPHTDESEWTLV